MATQLELEEEENRRYGCRCCCCICCHLRAAFVTICLLQLIGMVVAMAMEVHHLYVNPTEWLAIAPMALFVAFSLSAICSLVALRLHMPTLCLPHIAMQCLMLVYFALAAAGTASFIAKRVHDQDDVAMSGEGRLVEYGDDSGSRFYGRILKADENQVIMFVLGAMLCVYLLLGGFFGWFIYISLKLRQYLIEREVPKECTGGPTRPQYGKKSVAPYGAVLS